MKRFYKTMALVSLLGLGISNLFCRTFHIGPFFFKTQEEFIEITKGSQDDKFISLVKEKGVDTPFSDGNIPLHLAAFYRRTPLVCMLLGTKSAKAHGNKAFDVIADKDAKDDYGKMVLHLIVSSAVDMELVKVLLAAGVDKDAKDKKGYTPLRDAACARNTEMVKVLLAAGASRDIRDNHHVIGLIAYTPA
jgi:ankyrin repeat protein